MLFVSSVKIKYLMGRLHDGKHPGVGGRGYIKYFFFPFQFIRIMGFFYRFRL